MQVKPFSALLLIVSLFSLGACANRHKVIIDPQGVDMLKYQSDLEACKQISMQVESQAGEQAVGGAVVGGAIGAIIGGGDFAKKTAGVGFVSGLARGGTASERERMLVVKNCLRNRGYRILN